MDGSDSGVSSFEANAFTVLLSGLRSLIGDLTPLCNGSTQQDLSEDDDLQVPEPPP
jgi:hypothetical protein